MTEERVGNHGMVRAISDIIEGLTRKEQQKVLRLVCIRLSVYSEDDADMEILDEIRRRAQEY